MKSDGWFTGVVHLANLPDSIYLDLEDSYKKVLIQTLKKEIKCLFSFATKISEPIYQTRHGKYLVRIAYTIENFIRGRCFSLRLTKKLSGFLLFKGYSEFGLQEIEKHLKLIKAGKRGTPILSPKFPINFNSSGGAKLISAILHDGCIDVHHRVQYSNKNFVLRNNLLKVAKDVFGEFEADSSKEDMFLPTIIGKILIFGIGMNYGNKTINNVCAPQFISSSTNTEVIKSFLQQAFDDEGSVVIGKKSRSKHITFSLSVDVTNLNKTIRNRVKNRKSVIYAPKLLLDNIRMLKKLNINFNGHHFTGEHICKDGRIKHQWVISIGTFENLLEFSSKVNFISPEKAKKLEYIIKQLEQSLREKYEPRNKILNDLLKLQIKYGKITSRLLSEELDIPLSTASFWLSRLYRSKKIICDDIASYRRTFSIKTQKFKPLN